MAQEPPPRPTRTRRPLEKDLLGPWLAKPSVATSFRKMFTTQPTHFNQLHYMTMRNLLVRTDCGPSDDEVRELLTYMAELGIVEFKDDCVSAPANL